MQKGEGIRFLGKALAFRQAIRYNVREDFAAQGPRARERDGMSADQNRPRGRERNVTGPGKTVHKRGDGLGTGPVGSAGGHSGGGQGSGGGTRGTGGAEGAA